MKAHIINVTVEYRVNTGMCRFAGINVLITEVAQKIHNFHPIDSHDILSNKLLQVNPKRAEIFGLAQVVGEALERKEFWSMFNEQRKSKSEIFEIIGFHEQGVRILQVQEYLGKIGVVLKSGNIFGRIIPSSHNSQFVRDINFQILVLSWRVRGGFLEDEELEHILK